MTYATYKKAIKSAYDCGVRPYRSRPQHSGWTHTKWSSVKGPDVAKQAMGAARERSLVRSAPKERFFAETEECTHCGTPVALAGLHWRIHQTTAWTNVPRDFADEELSQGTFAVCPGCRHPYPHAYLVDGIVD